MSWELLFSAKLIFDGELITLEVYVNVASGPEGVSESAGAWLREEESVGCGEILKGGKHELSFPARTKKDAEGNISPGVPCAETLAVSI